MSKEILGNYIQEVSERNNKLTCNDVFSVTNSSGFIPSIDYFSKKVFSKELSNYKLVYRDMLAYNPSRINVGSIAVQDYKECVIVSPLYTVFSVDQKYFLPNYINYFLHSQVSLNQINNLTTGSVRGILKFSAKPAVENGRYPYLRMDNITYDGHLDLTNMEQIDIPEKEIKKCIVRKGDILFNRTNSKELVGKTCVFNLDTPMVIAGYIIRVRVNERVLPIYLSYVLNSKYGKQTLYDMCKSIVGQANINAQELQGIKY